MAKTKPAKYKQLERALMENLEARGMVEDIYRDKVREYMDLWERRQALKRDIADRGIHIYDAKRGMLVENRSVSLEVQVSRQMLAIYAALGFKDEATVAKAKGCDEDDEL